MMKKLFCIAASMLLLCILFAGCGKKAGSEEGRIMLNLSKELQNEQMELNSLPWFSTPEDAMKAFGLSANEIAVQERSSDKNEGGWEMYLPVYLEDLGTPANLTLYFRSSYPLVQEDKTLNKALTDACFSVCFADEAEKEAYTEKLRQTVDALEKELPEIYDDPYIGEDQILCGYRPVVEDGPASPFEYSFGTGWSIVALGEESRCERYTIVLGVRQAKTEEGQSGSALNMWV